MADSNNLISNAIAFFSFGRIVLIFVTYLFVRCLYQIVHYRFFHPLSKFPGPFWASVTRLWIAYYSFKGEEHLILCDLHTKYGPVVRVTPTLLVVSEASKLPEIYHRYADKTKHYITGSFGKTESVFNMQDHRQHAYFRKFIAGPYSFSSVKRMEPLVDARVKEWIAKLGSTFARTGDKLDFAPWAVYLAFDVISEMAFGSPLGFVEQGKDVDNLIQGFHDGLSAFGLLARLHPFTTWIKNTWVGEKYLVPKPEDDSGIGLMMRTRDRVLLERRRDIKTGRTADRVDLLQTFIDARTEEGQPLHEDYIKAEILLVLLAGADTTGTAFQGLLGLIFSNPRVYAKLMDEIDDATRAGVLSEIPQYEEVLAHCPFYVACIKETLRLWPSVPNLFPRLIGKGGMILEGKYAPEGTEISCNPWVVQRDKKLYGADANDFRPERWLEDEEKAQEFNKLSFTFGYGARVCLGKDIAFMELYKGPLQFLRSFHVKMLETEKPAEFVVKGGVAHWTDVWVKIERRQQVL